MTPLDQAQYLQKAWRLRNRCKHVGAPVHVGSAVCMLVLLFMCCAVHVDSAERRGADGNNAMA